MKMKTENKLKTFCRGLRRDWELIVMILPIVIFFLVFAYYPMYGVVIAFKKFSVVRGILGSPWVGMKYFIRFFESPYVFRLLRNTLLISVYNIVWGFPVPILFALMLDEIKNKGFKRVVQTVSYLPHFVSTVVICSMIFDLVSTNGPINGILDKVLGVKINFLGDPKWFRTIFVGSGIWQGFGWNSIIYLAAITGINPDLYEAAEMDGANRLRQVWHVTLPGIKPTILTLLILSLGNALSVGYEKIILLYSPATYETADVISSYVYRTGLLNAEYSYSAAVGLFNSVVNIMVLFLFNWVGKKFFEVRIF